MSTLEPNMNLILSTIGVDSGLLWEQNTNSNVNTIGSHDHSAGKGVAITPSGLNINSNLPFNGNNAISLRSVRFSSQASVLNGPADLGCLYEVGTDLYYNDGLGNQVRMTQSGAVAGSPGSIANLVSPASASYNNITGVFTWQSAANTPAFMDCCSVIIRNFVANSKGVTLAAPFLVASDYTITLPNLPSVTSLLTITSGGAMGTVSLTGSQQTSSSTSTFTTTSTTAVDVTNATVTITAAARTVTIALVPDGTTGDNGVVIKSSSNVQPQGYVALYENGSEIARFTLLSPTLPSGTAFNSYPPNAISYSYTPSAGSKTYKLVAFVDVSSPAGSSVSVTRCKLTAYGV